jgi:hypothetical protein
MSMDPGPDPSDLIRRLAAIDQELAALDDRLNRLNRGAVRGGMIMAACITAVIIVELIVKPPVYRWELVAALIALVLAVAGGLMQDLLLRNYRAEIRDLRSRVSP